MALELELCRGQHCDVMSKAPGELCLVDDVNIMILKSKPQENHALLIEVVQHPGLSGMKQMPCKCVINLMNVKMMIGT